MVSPRTHEHRSAATRAGLKYVTDGLAGITRRRNGGGWTYFAPNGARIRDADKRNRLNKLAIPPAWTDVWICPDPDGHIQATARDARGRKQYRYHAEYREARDRSKAVSLGPARCAGFFFALECAGHGHQEVPWSRHARTSTAAPPLARASST